MPSFARRWNVAAVAPSTAIEIRSLIADADGSGTNSAAAAERMTLH
jgi:hypothetical protein